MDKPIGRRDPFARDGEAEDAHRPSPLQAPDRRIRIERLDLRIRQQVETVERPEPLKPLRDHHRQQRLQILPGSRFHEADVSPFGKPP